jgi:hypothetical protein
MCLASDNPAICEIRAVIRFLLARNMSAAEIHRQLCAVHCQNVKDGRTNVHDEERSGRPAALRDDLVQSVEEKTYERRGFTISELSCEFPQISHTLLYEIVIVMLGYHHKFWATWVPKMIMGAHKTQRMASALTF